MIRNFEEFKKLVVEYFLTNNKLEELSGKLLGYPTEWLEEVGINLDDLLKNEEKLEL